MPIGLAKPNWVASNGVFVVYPFSTFLFSILSSKIHMLWAKYVSGKLESRIRYSVNITYNTFPFPKIAEDKQNALNMSALNILSVRERYPHKTMAQLYDPDLMPEDLKQAHEENDRLVESCYRAKPFTSDEERLEHLFNLYEQMIAEEAARV